MNQPSSRRNLSRRSLLQFGVGLAGTGTLTAWLGTGAFAQAVASQTTAKPTNLAATPSGASGAGGAMTPDAALAKLMEGNQRFVNDRRANPNQDMARLNEVAENQAPFAAILSCADSRVVPEIAFDQGIGDLFVVRTAGNIAITEGIASEEFAVGVLKSSLLMVIGHERCGAVKAAMKGGELPGIMESLTSAIQPAVQSTATASGDRFVETIKANVKLQVQHLKDSSVIGTAIKAGTLKVVGAYYDLNTGAISLVS